MCRFKEKKKVVLRLTSKRLKLGQHHCGITLEQGAVGLTGENCARPATWPPQDEGEVGWEVPSTNEEQRQDLARARWEIRS